MAGLWIRTAAGGLRAGRGLAGAMSTFACAAAVACSGGPAEDFLSRRCVDVLRYRRADLESISVEHVTRRQESRTLIFQATGPGGLRVTDRISCRFAPRDPWDLESATIGQRPLSTNEVALVNAELLLIDLSRHPERLRRDDGSKQSRPAGAETRAPS